MSNVGPIARTDLQGYMESMIAARAARRSSGVEALRGAAGSAAAAPAERTTGAFGVRGPEKPAPTEPARSARAGETATARPIGVGTGGGSRDDVASFGTIRRNFGSDDATREQGDLTGDKRVDIDDFFARAKRGGQGSGEPAGRGAAGDIGVIKENFGAPVSGPLEGDLNGDGVVDISDFFAAAKGSAPEGRPESMPGEPGPPTRAEGSPADNGSASSDRARRGSPVDVIA